MADLKYSQMLSYVLMILRIIKKTAPNHFLSLPAILDTIDYPSSFSEATEIGKYFEAKGFARIIFAMGDILIQIAPRGILELEEKGEAFEAGFQTYLKYLENELNKKIVLETFTPDENPKNKIILFANNIKGKLINKEGKNNDFVKDLGIIEIELSKSSPDFRIIEMKIDELSNLGVIAGDLRELRNYISHAS